MTLLDRTLDPMPDPSAHPPLLVDVACAVCGSHDRAPARVRTSREPLAERCGLPGGRSSWVVCSGCGLVYQSPRPAPEVVEELYLGGAYHEDRGGVPEHYVQYSLRRSAAALAWGTSLLAATPGRALDIGCGIGGALVRLRDLGWEVQGVEPDPVLSAVARDRFGLDARTGLFGPGVVDAEPGFDLAYSCHVWEHLDDPLGTSRAAHEVLVRRGGHLLIVVPTHRRARTLAWACFSTPHTTMFTDRSLRNLLGLAGFETVAHRYAAGADSELWLLARAVPDLVPSPIVPEPVGAVQRELALVPLRAPLGLPGRAVAHVRTLAADPRDFAERLRRGVARRIRT
jgi:SAM-dependent methyltransferase